MGAKTCGISTDVPPQPLGSRTSYEDGTAKVRGCKINLFLLPDSWHVMGERPGRGLNQPPSALTVRIANAGNNKVSAPKWEPGFLLPLHALPQPANSFLRLRLQQAEAVLGLLELTVRTVDVV